MVALQGEVGASSSTTRDMKSKINLAKHLMQSNNQLLSGVFRVMWEERRVGEAAGGPEEYLREVGVEIGDLRSN